MVVWRLRSDSELHGASRVATVGGDRQMIEADVEMIRADVQTTRADEHL
jgi:hypothetical protein